MKKLAFLLLFLLIPFSADALEISLSSSSVALGDVIEVQVEGAQEDRFCYTLTMGNKEVFSGEEVACDKGIVHPRKEGNYTLTVKSGGEEATAGFTVAKNVHVNPQQAAVPEAGGSIFTEGRIGTVFMQGDMCTVKVFAPGPWTAHTNDDFILLADTCGRNGDVLSFSVAPTEEDRQGTVFIRCGGDTLPLTVRQVAALQETAEEELSFSQERQFIFVQDQAFFVTELNGEEAEIAVSATGEWDAFSDDDFIALWDTCGRNGDVLSFSVAPTEEDRQGTVFIRCGGDTLPLTVRQVAALQETAEEELSFSQERQFIYVQDQAFFVTELNGEEAEIAVSATGEWDAFSEDDFLSFTMTDEGLSLYADENDTPYARQGTVTLQCGNAWAYVFVNQPGVPMGPDVLEAQLSMDTAILWQDGIEAHVRASGNTKQLVVSADGVEEVYAAGEWAKETEEGLFFQVNVPVTKTGEQMILFTAENDQGSGKKQKAHVNVLPEP
ncbi:MAG: BACON domain-containing protein, partial [Clostridia bacterium]|nr:BACON domain-containing protein [Clostridia bacterium]